MLVIANMCGFYCSIIFCYHIPNIIFLTLVSYLHCNNNQTNLISYSYYFCLNIKNFDYKSRKSLRKTKIVNLYNNKVDQK